MNSSAGVEIYFFICSFISVFPLYWMITAATNNTVDVARGKIWFGNQISVNFHNLLAQQNLWRALGNSFKYALTQTVIALIVCSLAGYGFELYHDKLKDKVFGILLLSMMVPQVATMIPLFKMISKAHLVNTVWGFILPAISTVFLIMMFRQNSRNFPIDILEAARIDGANELYTFHRIVFPIMSPAIATMGIMEILETNGCFDFLKNFLRTRNSKVMLWLMVLITFLLSANIESVTVTTMMLVLMHKLLAKRHERMIFGCAIMLAANCGGCLTVIGDPIGIALWSGEAVTASNYTFSLLVPVLIACGVPVLLLSRNLPDRLELQWVVAPYRGDDTRMGTKQRIIMGLVALAGLWFIPSFHNITKLSPFLGALCVLAVLWVMNEIYNRKLIQSDRMLQQRKPLAMQQGGLQAVLYVIGIMLALGAVKETGFLNQFAQWLWENVHNVFILGTIAGLISTVLESFTTAMTFFSMYDIAPEGTLGDAAWFVQNGAYWKIIAFCTAIGGSIISVGSLSGIVLMRMENIKISWFWKHFSGKVFLGWLLGMAFLFLQVYILN